LVRFFWEDRLGKGEDGDWLSNQQYTCRFSMNETSPPDEGGDDEGGDDDSGDDDSGDDERGNRPNLDWAPNEIDSLLNPNEWSIDTSDQLCVFEDILDGLALDDSPSSHGPNVGSGDHPTVLPGTLGSSLVPHQPNAESHHPTTEARTHPGSSNSRPPGPNEDSEGHAGTGDCNLLPSGLTNAGGNGGQAKHTAGTMTTEQEPVPEARHVPEATGDNSRPLNPNEGTEGDHTRVHRVIRQLVELLRHVHQPRTAAIIEQFMRAVLPLFQSLHLEAMHGHLPAMVYVAMLQIFYPSHFGNMDYNQIIALLNDGVSHGTIQFPILPYPGVIGNEGATSRYRPGIDKTTKGSGTRIGSRDPYKRWTKDSSVRHYSTGNTVRSESSTKWTRKWRNRVFPIDEFLERVLDEGGKPPARTAHNSKPRKRNKKGKRGKKKASVPEATVVVKTRSFGTQTTEDGDQVDVVDLEVDAGGFDVGLC
jgi:hypothetical protein